MSNIARVLQRSGAFPSGSHLAKRAASTDNGFHAILALLTGTHPSFVDQPILLAMNWPRQTGSQTIFEFYNEFTDTLRLRAIFMSGSAQMSTRHMVDCFINNCQHSNYWTQVSRFDRQDPSRASWFAPGALAVTLNNYLSNPDSPARQTKPNEGNRHKPSYHGSRHDGPRHDGARPPFQRRVNQLEAEQAIDELQMDHFANNIVAQLKTHDPKTIPTCLLCKDVAHSFDDCPLLNDNTFKSSFIIKMLSLVSRELRNGRKKQQELTTSQRMHQLLQTDSSASDTEPSVATDDTPVHPRYVR
jgi:hypothetical protein